MSTILETRGLTHVYGAGTPFERVALDHVDLKIEKGEILGVIGHTGSGKSTVIKLVERFADVSEGSITIEGIDIRDLSLHALRGQLGYVPQKAFLFSGTVEENVDYAADELNAERVRAAAEIAQADFVDDMDEGFKTEISQGGTNVSGGQRQRLAIARALATDARAFLFDDSFSALDYKTDAALRHALAEQLGGKTQIIVAQRISTVLNADQIVVLDDGRVVGAGTHEQLMEQGGFYAELYNSQFAQAS